MHARNEEVSLALGVADELQVAPFRREGVLVVTFRHPQGMAKASKHWSCKCLHSETLQREKD